MLGTGAVVRAYLSQRLMGTEWACLGPTNPEISRCCWCQDPVSWR